MLYIAKMHTRYPEFHGEGYFNFLTATTLTELNALIEDNSHDYSHEGTVKTRFQSAQNMVAKYPSKWDLNRKYFWSGDNA